MYEVVYIFNTAVAEDQITEKLDRYNAMITGDNGGQVTATDVWGRRQLAYPIKKQNAGYYVVSQFEAPATALPEFERLLKLDEDLLRYLVVLNWGEPTAPMSIQTRADRKRDDDDEDDDGMPIGDED